MQNSQEVITKRQVFLLGEDDVNTDSVEVSIKQYGDSDTGATVEFGDVIKIDSQDLIDLADLIKFLTRD